MPQVRKSYPNSSAHFFIAMKKLLLTFVALVCATVSYAQQQLVATLTHGDEITMFYGTYAYRDAMNAAVDGDVINLSGGGFQATTINKAVSIRGAGVEAEMPTNISGDFDIQIPSTAIERLTIEGCNVRNTITLKDTLNNAYFLRSSFSKLQCYPKSNIKNSMFVNCQVHRFDANNGTKSTLSLQFLNSYVSTFDNRDNTNANASFINCVICPYWEWGAKYNYICNSSLLNCILVYHRQNGYGISGLPSTTTASNCLSITDYYMVEEAFGDVAIGVSNQNINDFAVFTDSDYMKDLTDEAKATYLGSDGTPVGMYGGPLPFSLTPTYPQITKMNVASKTTADGKLSVDIEVSAAQ